MIYFCPPATPQTGAASVPPATPTESGAAPEPVPVSDAASVPPATPTELMLRLLSCVDAAPEPDRS